MIRISHVTLPPGLSALAQRDPDGELTVFVSETLPADRQRAAVRAALRAARRPDWRTALPAPSAAVLLGFAAGLLRRAARMLRAHPAAWSTGSAVAAATTAVAVYLAVAPHPHTTVSLPQATPGASQPSLPGPPAPSQPAPHPSRQHTRPARPASPPPSAPQVAPLTTMPAQPMPSPSPVPPPPPSPSPSPSPSAVPPSSPPPTPHPHGHCLQLLGIQVCLAITV